MMEFPSNSLTKRFRNMAQVPTPEQVEAMMIEKMGVTKEELAYLVRIVKHANSSSLMGNAKSIFDTFLS